MLKLLWIDRPRLGRSDEFNPKYANELEKLIKS